MPVLTSICYVSRLIHKACLDSLFKNSEVTAVVVAGPQLNPLPFLTAPEEFAKAFTVPVLASDQISSEQLIGLASQVDVAISVGFSRLLKKREIEAPRLGTFNLHPAELPKYRGKHPDLLAIMDGENHVGMTLHRMNTGIDTGPVVARSTEPILPDDSIVTLTDRLYSRGANLLERLFTDLAATGQVHEEPQPKGFDSLELRRSINWNDSAWRISNLVRALTYPWPMAKTVLGGRSLLISRLQVVEDRLINPGCLLAASDYTVRIGTGGNSVDVLEIRGENREIIPLQSLAVELQPMVGIARFGEDLPVEAESLP